MPVEGFPSGGCGRWAPATETSPGHGVPGFIPGVRSGGFVPGVRSGGRKEKVRKWDSSNWVDGCRFDQAW